MEKTDNSNEHREDDKAHDEEEIEWVIEEDEEQDAKVSLGLVGKI